jgi:Torus domain/WW domain
MEGSKSSNAANLLPVLNKSWICVDCFSENYPTRSKCYKCSSEKPSSGDKQIGGASVNASDSSVTWKEVYDPKSRQIYYWNIQTNETSWSRPEELGPVPVATGFFGRGSADSASFQASLEEKIAAWLKRPARVQSTEDLRKFQRLEGANELNIWYGKYQGEHWSNKLGKSELAKTRCNPDVDCGYTKSARLGQGGAGEVGDYCLFFARGACTKGPVCSHLHLIPSARDDAASEVTKDVFGVGSINDECRTLYVGGIAKKPSINTDNKDELKAEMAKHITLFFQEFGEVEVVNYIPRLSIAFVRYRYRANAEFAREAMDHQTLGNGDVLNLRWAYEDPNPTAKQSALDADVDAVLAGIEAKNMRLELPSSNVVIYSPDGGEYAHENIASSNCGVNIGEKKDTMQSEAISTSTKSNESMMDSYLDHSTNVEHASAIELQSKKRKRGDEIVDGNAN